MAIGSEEGCQANGMVGLHVGPSMYATNWGLGEHSIGDDRLLDEETGVPQRSASLPKEDEESDEQLDEGE